MGSPKTGTKRKQNNGTLDCWRSEDDHRQTLLQIEKPFWINPTPYSLHSVNLFSFHPLQDCFPLLYKSRGLDPPSYRLAAFRRGCDKLCRCARSQIHKSAIGLNSGDESKTVLERYQVIVIYKKQKTLSWRRFHFQCAVSKE